jgi:hypothetical protein
LIDAPERVGGSSRSTRSPGRFAGLAVTASLVVTAGLLLFVWGPLRSHPAADRYGGLPGWLPRSSAPVGRTVVATVDHPQLGVEGDTVLVELARSSGLVTAVGPQVPESGEFPVPAVTPCSFTVTLVGRAGQLPVGADGFSLVDEEGRVHVPTVAASPERAVPSAVGPGGTLTLTLDAVLPTGSGELRWSPQGGAPVVSWDFDVEID